MDLAIVGLERSGKTALFNAVTRGHSRAGSYGAMEPDIGVVKVPDPRLDRLCEVLQPKKVSHAEARYLDFPGSLSLRTEGPEPAHLAALAQCDALVHVVRAFRDETVPHPEGSVDPDRDVAAVNLEIAFADAAVLQRRYRKLEITVRSASAAERAMDERELALVARLREALEREEPLRTQELSGDERRVISGYQLLTDKPLILVLNVDEADIGETGRLEEEFASRWRGPGIEVTALSAKLEQELAELPDDEAAEFRSEMGVETGGLDRMLRVSQKALGLITFFTVNEADGHAWAIPSGASALEAAGKVHTDMARGFIRAEAIDWEDLVECGSFAEARKKALLRTEGKEYVVRDGELLHILFNV